MSSEPSRPEPAGATPAAHHERFAHHDRFAWRARIRKNPLALFWYRIGVGLAGLLLMVAAAATGWLPGPGGIPLFMLGLLVWSSEFAWAHRLMLWFKSLFDRFTALPAATRRLLVAGCLLAAIAGWYAIAAWHGLPSWLPEALADHLDRLPLLDR